MRGCALLYEPSYRIPSNITQAGSVSVCLVIEGLADQVRPAFVARRLSKVVGQGLRSTELSRVLRTA